ncbi:ROK family transcriptional regulator [Amphibiibacter pelophylacis]|uniref:ROK family transcriptional regulator n=1 Tax=Amphibiibacter pelophylacis TaxID=1799477 RepID=A0ACC6P0U9_9BURK
MLTAVLKNFPRHAPRHAQGSNHSDLRQFNEGVVLQAIRLHGAQAKADLARITGLTTQTVGVIIQRMLDDGLVLKQAALRGRVGQPSVPIAIHPEGAYAVGIRLGRRQLDVSLVDFTGRAVLQRSTRYDFPEPEAIFQALDSHLQAVRDHLADAVGRVRGAGLAMPFSMSGWQQQLELPPERLSAWDSLDVRERVQRLSGWPVTVIKDTAAACLAELMQGAGQRLAHFLYVFMDTFVGGAVVQNGRLHSGLHGNAGAIASLPLREAHQAHEARGDAPPPQLLSSASLLRLEQAFQRAGLEPSAAYDGRALQPPWRDASERWLDDTACGLAFAVLQSSALLDHDAVVLDGSCDPALLQMLLERTQTALTRYSWEGLLPPRLICGQLGRSAGVLGAALVPLEPTLGWQYDISA